MNKLRKWLYRISGAEDDLRIAEGENKRLKAEIELMQQEARDAERTHGQYCEHCKNSYKKKTTYYMGIVMDGGWGCKLKIPCEKFEEKEEEK